MRNLLKHLMVCGECGANFSVGKSNETSKNYISGGRTYKCYGRVNRKDKPRTCTNGAELRQWKLMDLFYSCQFKCLLRLIFMADQYFKDRKFRERNRRSWFK